ncbi:hypothetical protein GCM10010266_45380 [Streptomyces griseomycini]|nr:hypothetical protein GCM10010266_45380 [Streptomyces griseomycini]
MAADLFRGDPQVRMAVGEAGPHLCGGVPITGLDRGAGAGRERGGSGAAFRSGPDHLWYARVVIIPDSEW